MCVRMYDRDWIGQWYEHPCTNPAPYICEYPRAGHTNPQPTTTPSPSGACIDISWTLINGRCYFGPVDTKSFAQAENECSKFGSHLISFGSKEEEDATA
jgi:hypothetical protein